MVVMLAPHPPLAGSDHGFDHPTLLDSSPRPTFVEEVAVTSWHWLPTNDERHAFNGHSWDYRPGDDLVSLCGLPTVVPDHLSDLAWFWPTCQTCWSAASKIAQREEAVSRRRIAGWS
jgi:zinc-finger